MTNASTKELVPESIGKGVILGYMKFVCRKSKSCCTGIVNQLSRDCAFS